MDDKVLYGLISSAATLIGFIPYVYSIFHGKTKPHFFTWLVWGALTGIIFAIQVSQHAGPGSWGIGLTALTCVAIAVLSFFWGQRSGSRFDWLALIFSIATIPLWLLAKDPTLSAVLITLIDVAAFYPTVAKTYRNPWNEHLFYYWIWLIKYPASVIALNILSTANAVYPVTWTICGVAFLGMTLYRRRILRKIQAD